MAACMCMCRPTIPCWEDVGLWGASTLRVGVSYKDDKLAEIHTVGITCVGVASAGVEAEAS
jgi:hypothetical protein